MKFFGQKVGPGSLNLTHFTFGNTQTHTIDLGLDTPRESPLLKLPAELRNDIYEHVSRDEKVLKLSAGKVVLPPLGGVCKQIRAELRGVFEQQMISNTDLEIQALVVNFNFDPLFRWLDEHDQRPISPAFEELACRPPQKLRKLVIHATCRPELLLAPWLERNPLLLSPLLQEERLSALLLHNLTTTLKRWSTSLDMYMARYAWGRRVANPSLEDVLSHYLWPTTEPDQLSYINTALFRRRRSGYDYQVTIVADESFRRRFDHSATTPPNCGTSQGVSSLHPDEPALQLFDTMYKSVKGWRWMRTDIDRKFALMLREACQSGRSKLHGKALTWHDEVYDYDLSMDSFRWWTRLIVLKAGEELERIDTELHAEQQERLKYVLDDLVLEEELRDIRLYTAAADNDVEEMTAVMAQWHL
jgi:hypothetical protein